MEIKESSIEKFISENDIKEVENSILNGYDQLINGNGKGNDFLGWLHLWDSIDEKLIEDIVSQAEKIRKKAKVYVVIGIGGSYLGARAVIEALQNNFNFLQQKERLSPFIVYAGNTLSEDYISELLDILNNMDYCLCVISKSGTTTEPAIAFRILKEHLENKYGEKEAKERIIAITDKQKGALKLLANEKGYKTYIIEDNIGGRFSVLTPVGLLPIAVAGFDIRKLIFGARKMSKQLIGNRDISSNCALKYAAYRNILNNKGKEIEILVNYLPNLTFLSEWWKQLFGESCGKEGKGLFPASVSNTTDLHSMGQYIQEGKRIIFETIISVENAKNKVNIPYDERDIDGLNYLHHFSINQINHKAMQGTLMAHIDGGVPQIVLSIEKLDEENIGELIYFFFFSCAISGYAMGINPFDQPGVEAYKKNMFHLLGK
ncbi:MAG: glucose-6-phosphate isomerase [Bacteroidales bacterium]|jgi:glucose-6-phosphate isomerase|nr:glucose-6-phosphate isomerase [Bacteroidales bacterium]